MAIELEQKIFPIPTNGDTIPPKKNGRNPNSAEALPARLRSKPIASADPAGSISPRPNNSRKNTTSTNKNGKISDNKKVR